MQTVEPTEFFAVTVTRNRSTETIALFNVDTVAQRYARECNLSNPDATYGTRRIRIIAIETE